MTELGHFDVVAAGSTPQRMTLLAPHGKPITNPGPDGKPVPVEIPVYGFDNDRVIMAGREFDTEYAKNGHQLHEQDYNRHRRAHIAAAAVASWPDLSINGEAITPFNAARIMSQRSFSWIADQILIFGGNRGNYFRAVPKE